MPREAKMDSLPPNRQREIVAEVDDLEEKASNELDVELATRLRARAGYLRWFYGPRD